VVRHHSSVRAATGLNMIRLPIMRRVIESR
jgi:hypothetical protein